MRKLTCAALFFATVTASSTARADTTEAFVMTVPASAVSAITFTSIDLIKSPRSKVYAGAELGINLGFAAINGYLAATIDVPDDDSNTSNYILAGLATWNAVLAVHGGYLLMTEE